ncbi:hypothetical protein BaRGS_00034602, partial [Batillaria attramentaria]
RITDQKDAARRHALSVRNTDIGSLNWISSIQGVCFIGEVAVTDYASTASCWKLLQLLPHSADTPQVRFSSVVSFYVMMFFASQKLMSSQQELMMLSIAVMMSLVVVARGEMCTSANGEGPSMDELLFKSQVVMMGRVVERYSNPQLPTSYTAEVEVFCVYKGGPLPLKVNVTNAGKVPDTCFASNFTIGDEVLAYLNRHEDGRFSPTYTESPAGYKDEIFSACGIAIEYPGNLKPEDATYNCDEDADYLYDEATCLRYQPKDKVEEIDVKVPSDDGKVDMGQPEPGDKQGDQNNDQQKTNVSPILKPANNQTAIDRSVLVGNEGVNVFPLEVEEIDVKVPSDDGKVDMGQPEPGDKQGDQSYDQQKTN